MRLSGVVPPLNIVEQKSTMVPVICNIYVMSCVLIARLSIIIYLVSLLLYIMWGMLINILFVCEGLLIRLRRTRQMFKSKSIDISDRHIYSSMVDYLF